jgi:hypothetical protein
MSYTLTPTAPMALQTTATSATGGNGGILYLRGNCERLTVVFQSTGTTSGGTILLEEAYYDLDHGDPVYAGTWSLLATVSASTVSGTAQQTQHFAGSFYAVRARISADITGGGSISVWAWGN